MRRPGLRGGGGAPAAVNRVQGHRQRGRDRGGDQGECRHTNVRLVMGLVGSRGWEGVDGDGQDGDRGRGDATMQRRRKWRLAGPV